LRAELAGVVDLTSNSLELTSLSIPLGRGSVVLRGRIEDIFNSPQPRLEAELLEIPLAVLAAKSPQFTTRIDDGIQAGGELRGRIWSDGFRGPLFGTVEVGPGWVQFSESVPRLEFNPFQVSLEGSRGQLGPLRAVAGEDASAEVTLKWDSSKHSAIWQLRGEEMSLPTVTKAASIFGWSSNLAEIPQGHLGMRLDITTGSADRPQVAGWARISDAVVDAYGVKEPLQIENALFQFQRDLLRITSLSAGLGPVDLSGTAAVRFSSGKPARVDSEATAPSIEFTLQSSEADVAAIAMMFGHPPTTSSFFGFVRSVPPKWTWLESALVSFWNGLQARGNVRAGALHYLGITAENVEADVFLHRGRLEVPKFSARIADGATHGMATIDFAQSPPAFAFESHHTNVSLDALMERVPQWRGTISGNLNGGLSLNGSGRTFIEIVSQLHGSGEATGKEVVLRNTPWTEALGLAVHDEAPTVSFASAFQIEEGVVHISDMRLIPTHATESEDGPASSPEAVLIRGDVAFNQRLDLTVRREPEGSTTQWAGTLAEPRFSRSIPAATARAVSASQRDDTSLSSE
jgi:hypothetical protein